LYKLRFDNLLLNKYDDDDDDENFRQYIYLFITMYRLITSNA